MALKSTVFKVDLQIADMDRHYYQTHSLTMAQHPSETNERLMVRLVAFARHANEALTFTKGLSESDEPDLWLKDLTGAITLWIEVGQPDEKQILKACGRAEDVILYTYSTNSNIWWNKINEKLDRTRNLTVINLKPGVGKQLEALAQRAMQLQCTIEDGQMWLSDASTTVQVEWEIMKAPLI